MFPTFEATQLQANANNKGNTPNQQQFVEKSTQNKDKQNARLDPQKQDFNPPEQPNAFKTNQ
jgi:hypothetical protein